MYVLEFSLKIKMYVCMYKGSKLYVRLMALSQIMSEMAMHTKFKQGHTVSRDAQRTTQET